MKNIRKLKSYGKAVAGSALLVGATLTGAAGLASAQSGSSGDATLADYPHPFVDDEGNLDSTVVVGTDGKQVDVVSAIDIAGNLGNNAFSSETVEASAGAVDGEQEEDTIRDTIDISIDASDYSAFTRETVEDEDGDDVFVTESADFSGSSNVNGTDAEIAFDEGDISYSIKYSPGFSQGDDITLLGEEYELVEIVDTGEVKLGSTLEQSLTVGEDYTHGPYTVEVTGRSSGDNPEAVVRVSSEEETLETRALETDEAIELENDQEVDDTEFTVNATSVIFYEDGTSEVSLESTVQDTTLEEGEDLPMDDRYEVNTLGVNSEENRLSEIKTSNTVQTVDEPEDDEEDETAHLETGDSYTGPSEYFTLTNQGLSNEATGEIEIEEDYEVTYEDSNNFEHSLDISKVEGSGSAQLYSFTDGSSGNSNPTMFVDDGTNSGTYEDGDDILKISRPAGTAADLGGSTLNDFSGSEYYISPAGIGFDGSQAIVDSEDTTLDSGDTVEKDGSAGALTALAGTNYQIHEDGSGNTGYDGDGSGGYGEAIYNTGGGDSTVDTGDDRFTSVTVNSGTDDSDVTTVDLGLSNYVAVGSGDADVDKSIGASNSEQLIVIDQNNANSKPNWESDSDTVVLDNDASGTITEGDIALIENEGVVGDGTQLTSTEASNLADNSVTNDKTVYTQFDYNVDGSSNYYIDLYSTNEGTGDNTASSSSPDIQLTGGPSAVTSTPSTYNEQTGDIARWNADGSGSQTVEDSIYFDVGDTGSVANGDTRLSGFTETYTQGSTVSSGDVDAGISVTDFAGSDYYQNNDGSGSLTTNDAILSDTGSNDANLESEDDVEVSGSISGAGQSFTPGDSGDATMYAGSSGYDGSQEVLEITRETSGTSEVALDGTSLNNFASSVKHTTSGTYSDSDSIVDDVNSNDVYDSGTDTVIKGSEPSGGGQALVTTSDSDTEFYTDISGYPLEIEYDSGSEEATFTYEEFEETVSSGESESFTTGYGFSFTADFTQNNDEELVISGSDTVLSTEEDAKISFSSDEVTVTEENSETITVEYDGSDQLDRISFSGDPSDLTDTDDGDSTLTGFGSAVELDSDSSATVTYPDEPLEQLSAFGSIGEGTGEGSVMSPTGWASGSAATDEEASTDQNLVLVGGPLVNDLTGDLADQGSTWNSSEYESNQGVGVLDLVNDAFDGNTALVVAGWQADDTSAAAEYLVENAGAQELEGRSTVQVDTESGELLQ